jgi:hypothetical protein
MTDLDIARSLGFTVEVASTCPECGCATITVRTPGPRVTRYCEDSGGYDRHFIGVEEHLHPYRDNSSLSDAIRAI